MTPLLGPDGERRRTIHRARLSVVLALIGSLAMGLHLGWKEGYLRPSARFHFDTESSKSISTGMAVHLSGFKVGQVSRVELQPARNVRVELVIYKPYLDLIRTDSEVLLAAGGFMEDPLLEIAAGPTGMVIAEPGSELRFRRQLAWSDQMGDVVQRAGPMIENMDSLLARARDPDGELQATLRNLAGSSARLESWVPGFLERVDAALVSVTRTSESATRVLTPLAQTDGDLQAALRDIRAMAAELPPILADVRALTSSLRATAASLESSVRAFAPEIPGLVTDTRRTVTGAGEVVDAVRDFGLLRGRINRPAPPTLLPTTPP